MAMVTPIQCESYEEHSGLWYHSRGYITDDGEFINMSKRKHYMCASVMEWSMG